jgi:hypothetical protein
MVGQELKSLTRTAIDPGFCSINVQSLPPTPESDSVFASVDHRLQLPKPFSTLISDIQLLSFSFKTEIQIWPTFLYQMPFFSNQYHAIW